MYGESKLSYRDLAPMIKYKFQNVLYNAAIVGVSPSTIGLYIQNVIAAPTPSSATPKTPIIDVNNAFSFLQKIMISLV